MPSRPLCGHVNVQSVFDLAQHSDVENADAGWNNYRFPADVVMSVTFARMTVWMLPDMPCYWLTMTVEIIKPIISSNKILLPVKEIRVNFTHLHVRQRITDDMVDTSLLFSSIMKASGWRFRFQATFYYNDLMPYRQNYWYFPYLIPPDW